MIGANAPAHAPHKGPGRNIPSQRGIEATKWASSQASAVAGPASADHPDAGIA